MPMSVVRPPMSDELVDAMAQLRVALDEKLVVMLKADAVFLLGVQLPRFDHATEQSLATLAAIQKAAVALQCQLQKRVASLQAIARKSANPAVRPLLETVLTAYQQAFEQAEQVRWDAMNTQAEKEIASGAGKSFGNVEAALKFLAKQKG